ncbi:MAG: hypothetical protein ACYTJ0_02900 [Planctomycetota bacterium]|jgi:hypothetical protein
MRRWSIGLAALAGAVATADPARAAFEGLSTTLVAQPTIDGLAWDVYRLYVDVTNPADTVEIVSGNAANPVVIAGGGVPGFYQNTTFDGAGGDFEPNSFLFIEDPDLEHDTFVTIGTPVFVPSSGATQLLEFQPGFACDRLTIDNGGWYRIPGDPLTVAGDALQVMIGQLTVPRGSVLSGSLRVAGRFDEVPEQHIVGLPLPLCAADVNADRAVDVDDLISVILAWGPCAPEQCPCPDANRDGMIDVDDLIEIILSWGACD